MKDRAMGTNDEAIIATLAQRHHSSTGGVKAALDALRNTGGRMAQFTHQDFGGMAQWSNGMTMVGDMFNSEMKAKLDAICTDLVAYLEASPDKNLSEASSKGDHDTEVSYRSQLTSNSSRWPVDLGAPSSTGAQNNMRYAVFPSSRRLAISDGDIVNVYDTGDHEISGVSQSQSADRTITFTSQNGLVRIADLEKIVGFK
jgi:hypothetical protein